VRQFGDFDVELEFRAFVYKRKFTGLTQYNHLVYFPKMVKSKDTISRLLHKFMEKEMSEFPMENSVLDFAMKYPENEEDKSGEYEGYKIYVIEINPLAEFAGTGMFTWENDRDVLLGKKPFEFRTVNSEPANVLSELSPDCKPFL